MMQTCLKPLYIPHTGKVYSVECVFAIKSNLSFMFHTTYGAVCFQFTHYGVMIVWIFVHHVIDPFEPHIEALWTR